VWHPITEPASWPAAQNGGLEASVCFHCGYIRLFHESTDDMPNVVRGSLCLLLPALSGVQAITKELFTTNAVCKQRYCVNPVFPALNEMPHFDRTRFTKVFHANVTNYLDFCKDIVDYDVSIQIPSDNNTGGTRSYADPLAEVISRTDKSAAKAYFYHLAGMGLEPWDHTYPTQASSLPQRPCALSVARLVCFTYFPKAFYSVREGAETQYIRPCKSSCNNYLEACNIECCDDGLSCTWNAGLDGSSPRATQDLTGTVLLMTGYVDTDGPSLACTGHGSRLQIPSSAAVLAVFFLVFFLV